MAAMRSHRLSALTCITVQGMLQCRMHYTVQCKVDQIVDEIGDEIVHYIVHYTVHYTVHYIVHCTCSAV